MANRRSEASSRQPTTRRASSASTQRCHFAPHTSSARRRCSFRSMQMRARPPRGRWWRRFEASRRSARWRDGTRRSWRPMPMTRRPSHGRSSVPSCPIRVFGARSALATTSSAPIWPQGSPSPGVCSSSPDRTGTRWWPANRRASSGAWALRPHAGWRRSASGPSNSSASPTRTTGPRLRPPNGTVASTLASGEDASPVRSEPYVAKGRGKERTFQQDLSDTDRIRAEAARLAHELDADLAGENRPIATVVVKVRFASFFTTTRGVSFERARDERPYGAGTRANEPAGAAARRPGAVGWERGRRSPTPPSARLGSSWYAAARRSRFARSK